MRTEALCQIVLALCKYHCKTLHKIFAILCTIFLQNTRVLWQYLKDNHGLGCGSSTFRRYIAKTPEFAAYFTDQVRIPSPKGTTRFETPPGQQAQFDWKESMVKK